MEDFPEQDERSFAPTPLRCLPHLARPSEMGVVLAILFILFLCPGAGLLEGTFPGLWAAVCLVHTACFTPAQACFQGRFWRQESFLPPLLLVTILSLLAFCVSDLERNGSSLDLIRTHNLGGTFRF